MRSDSRKDDYRCEGADMSLALLDLNMLATLCMVPKTSNYSSFSLI